MLKCCIASPISRQTTPLGFSPTCAKWWRHRSGSSAPTIDVSWDGGGGDLLPCPRSPFLAVHFTIIRRDAAKTTRGPRRDTHVDYPPLPRHNAPVADSTGGGTRLTWQPTIASVANTSTRRAAAPQRPAALRRYVLVICDAEACQSPPSSHPIHDTSADKALPSFRPHHSQRQGQPPMERANGVA
jgi:hypothetical protein